MGMEKQTTFHQSAWNQEKMGAYYTDLSQAEIISKYLEFQPGCAVCDPAAGDGNMIRTVLGARESDSKIFLVELNKDTCTGLYSLLKEEKVEAVLNADYLHGTIISRDCFDAFIANPPYGNSSESKRLETDFLLRIYEQLRSDGVLVWIVPEYVLKNEEHQRVLLGKFQVFGVFRFEEHVYKQFKQCVVFARAKRKHGWTMDMITEFNKQLEDIPTLDKDYFGAKLKVLSTEGKYVKQFTTKEFDETKARQSLAQFNGLADLMRERLNMRPFESMRHMYPPVPLNEGNLFVLTASSTIDGVVGNSKKKNLHLQRGVAKVVETSHFETDDNTGATVEVVETSTKVINTIIENDGTITTL